MIAAVAQFANRYLATPIPPLVGHLRTTIQLGAVLAAVATIAAAAWYVFSEARIVPVGDQWWDLVYIAVKTRAGILGPEDVFMHIQGHRPAVIRSIIALSTILTDYDVRVLRFLPFFVVLVNLGLAMLLLQPRELLIPVSLFFFAIVLFTLHVSKAWLDLSFSVWQLVLTFTLLGLLILQRMQPGWLAFTLLVTCAILASLSTGAGLPSWICFPIAALGISAYRRPKYVIVWMVALVLFMVLYGSNYALNPNGSEKYVSLSRAWKDGILRPILYLLQFQSARFDIGWDDGASTNVLAIWFTLICIVMLGLNLWQIRSKGNLATVTLWADVEFLFR